MASNKIHPAKAALQNCLDDNYSQNMLSSRTDALYASQQTFGLQKSIASADKHFDER